MKISTAYSTNLATRIDAGSKSLLPALVAVGSGLAVLPAAALELGEANVYSSLGQPLRASIAYALGPNEALMSSCVTLLGGQSASGLPGVGDASIRVADGFISVTGKTLIREPLVSMHINIRCPYTPRLSRDYMLFVDPAQPTTKPVIASATAVTVPHTITTPAAVVSRRRVVSQEPIGSTTRFQVSPGESLSEIAQRVENRPAGLGLWDVVAMIFDANPSAFIDNNPNLLMAGSWLQIPDFNSADPVTFASRNAFFIEPVAASTAASSANVAVNVAATAYPGISVDEQATEAMVARPNPNTFVAEPTSDAVVVKPISDAFIAEPISDTFVTAPTGDTTATAAGSALADLKPGDIIGGSDNPFVVIGDTSVIIPDTTLEGPVTSSSSPNVATAVIQPRAPATSSTNWLLWLAGSGVAIISGLVLFGRRLRSRFASTPIGAAAATPQRRRTDGDTQNIEALSEFDVDPMLESLTAENLTLDADLIIGTGLQQGTDVDVAQDFGFAASTALDLELPEETPNVAEDSQTDIIPPMFFETGSILESEVLASDTDDVDEYDMSVIVDATKMPRLDEVTERDLEAIAVDIIDETQDSGSYTLTKDVDIEALEQDYEDEFTATQALNIDIEKAAAALVKNMDDGDSGDKSDMSLASVTALDVPSNLPAKNDDISDRGDKGSDDAVTVNMTSNDETAEMPAREIDVTADLEIQTGKSGSKGG